MKTNVALRWVLSVSVIVLLAVGCGEKKAPRPAAAKEPAVAVEAKPAEQPGGQETLTAKPVTQGTAPTPAKEEAKVGGQLVPDKEGVDFGVVDPGQKVEGMFTLTNKGPGPLEIKSVGSSCGCTVGQLKTKQLGPGESTVLSVSFTAQDHPGKTNKKLWVDVAPPSQPARLSMNVDADVRKSIEVKPERWTFELRDAPQNHVPLELQSLDGRPFSVASVINSGQAVTVTFDPNAKAAKHVLPIKVDLAKLRQSRAGAVTLKLQDAKVKNVTIPYTVLLPFEVRPGVRNFRLLAPGREEKAEFTVVSNYGQAFELGEIKSQEGMIKVLKTAKTGDGYLIEVGITVPAGTTKKVVNDYLNIEIKNHPEEKLRVQCYGRVEEPNKP